MKLIYTDNGYVIAFNNRAGVDQDGNLVFRISKHAHVGDSGMFFNSGWDRNDDKTDKEEKEY